MTGSTALNPGNAVVSPKMKALVIMNMNPRSPTSFFVLIGGRRTSSAPSPNSQALVGSE
jgi:NAD kinase